MDHVMQRDPAECDEPIINARDDGESLRTDLLANVEHARALREQSNTLSEMLSSLWRKFGR